MNTSLNIRHSKWYEKFFFNAITQIIITTLICAILPAFLFWGETFFIRPIETQSNSFFGVIVCNVCIIVTLKTLLRFPGNRSIGFIISTVLSYYLILFVVMFLLRFNYAIYYLICCLNLSLIYGFIGYFFGRRWVKPKIALIPFGQAALLNNIPHATWYIINEPAIHDDRRYNMLVTDLHSDELTATWQKFLAECVLSGMPVLNARQVEESLTGRVRIRHMYENQLGSLLPSPIYSLIKRIFDVIIVLLVMPVVLPIMCITAIAISIESNGSILFVQNRVGKGAKEFKIYKFRSMSRDSEKDGAKFASSDDMRVTKVGQFIRKMRIDELPQFFNVIKGDMSLIGPRPEQKIFVEEFEEKIPFYNYRHIVRPGISGWAQVMQGYTADAEETQIKVEHDFYYIKNFSLWLDILILFKTVKTILTGFGAR